MVDRMISPFTLMSGPILFILSLVLVRSYSSWTDVITAICIYILWVLTSRTLRVLPHFYRCPGALRRCLHDVSRMCARAHLYARSAHICAVADCIDAVRTSMTSTGASHLCTHLSAILLRTIYSGNACPVYVAVAVTPSGKSTLCTACRGLHVPALLHRVPVLLRHAQAVRAVHAARDGVGHARGRRRARQEGRDCGARRR